MVMSLDADEQQNQVQTPDAPVDDLGDADAPPVVDSDQEATEGTFSQTSGGEAPQTSGTAQEQPASEQPQQQPEQPQQPNRDQAAAIEELYRRRQVDAQRQWEQQVIRKAQTMERRAQEQGTDPQAAKQIGRQYVMGQKELRDQESKALDLVGFVEGRQNAAMHYALQNKLVSKQVIEDLVTLTRFRSPQEMELEAKRMAQLRSQAAEIAQLKQGRVPPQTFDNSQGAAEATSNVDRLLEAYNNGDRSEAAVKAARRMAFGA